MDDSQHAPARSNRAKGNASRNTVNEPDPAPGVPSNTDTERQTEANGDGQGTHANTTTQTGAASSEHGQQRFSYGTFATDQTRNTDSDSSNNVEGDASDRAAHAGGIDLPANKSGARIHDTGDEIDNSETAPGSSNLDDAAELEFTSAFTDEPTDVTSQLAQFQIIRQQENDLETQAQIEIEALFTKEGVDEARTRQEILDYLKAAKGTPDERFWQETLQKFDLRASLNDEEFDAARALQEEHDRRKGQSNDGTLQSSQGDAAQGTSEERPTQEGSIDQERQEVRNRPNDQSADAERPKHHDTSAQGTAEEPPTEQASIAQEL